MSRLYTNSPIQNRDWPTIEAYGRAYPLVALEQLKRLDDSCVETPIPHLWNLAVLESELANQDTREYLLSESEKLRGKYNTIGGLLTEAYQLYTDLDPEFTDFALDKIEDLIDKGIIYREVTGFFVCDQCFHTKGISDGADSACKACGSTEVSVRHEPALFIDLPTDKSSLLRDRVVGSKKLPHYEKQAKNLPDRFVISKRRHQGVNLGRVGLGHTVIDPRIALGLLGQYVGHKYGVDEVIQVQGESLMLHSVPFATILNQDSSETARLRYLVTRRLPQDLITKALDEPEGIEAQFMRKAAIFFLIGRDKDPAPDEVTDIVHFFRKSVYVNGELVSKLSPTTDRVLDNPALQELIREHAECMRSINIHEAFLCYRRIVKLLGKLAKENGNIIPLSPEVSVPTLKIMKAYS